MADHLEYPESQAEHQAGRGLSDDPNLGQVIPLELASRQQWVGHKNKHPIDPATGQRASTTKPSTWGSFRQAIAAVERFGLDGVGFVFTSDDPYCGVDLDDAIDADGTMKLWARSIIERLDGYTEYSQSGTGLHVIVRATKPAGPNRRDIEDGHIEIYDRARFFVVTGRPLEVSA